MTSPSQLDGRGRLRGARAGLAAILAVGLACIAPTESPAQELTGVALGPDGEPLAGIPVVLHRVGALSGAMAGTDTTGPDGAFRFPLEAGDSAVYFAAVRYGGSLYVGPATQAGGSAVSRYVLQVSPSTEIGAVGTALSNPRTPPQAARPASTTRGSGGSSDTGALLLVAVLALAAAGVFIYTAPRVRRRRTRETVLEVAGIENRLTDPASELSATERERLRARRDRLKGQLAPRD